ncbi:MAG TPA: hypothetical protein VGD37_08860 [Kofleriaceae bacterium]|jgi:hypothetical protein
MESGHPPLSWARTGLLTAAAASFLFVAEPLAAIIVILFSGFLPVCGSGGDPTSCHAHPASASAVYLLIAALAGATTIGLALIVRRCLGPLASTLGWPLTVVCSLVCSSWPTSIAAST